MPVLSAIQNRETSVSWIAVVISIHARDFVHCREVFRISECPLCSTVFSHGFDLHKCVPSLLWNEILKTVNFSLDEYLTFPVI